MERIIEELKNMESNSNNIKRIVVWGLRKKWHTHRFIHKAFYENAKKLGYDTIWVEDDKKNADLILSGDLIISADPIGKMVPEKFSFEEYNIPVRDDVYYCLHNMKDVFTDRLNKGRLLKLEVYHNTCEEKCDIKLGLVRFFDSKENMLYQPWGTDLLDYEFKKPVFRKNKFVFWVGSIWNDENNFGNLNQISDLKRVLKKNKLWFIALRFIPDWLNIFLVRISRIAPAISGRRQVETNYLPCRVFKNISYGQLGITNVNKFKELFGNSFVRGGDGSIDSLIDGVLSLSEKDYKSVILAQQEIVKNYTYKQSLESIIKCFDFINKEI